jgi:hypothetical protein
MIYWKVKNKTYTKFMIDSLIGENSFSYGTIGYFGID